ncbi:MAG TPA: ArnT family glycosyltransferase [Candidatus Hypogeohydataceae bacterium YC40]
MRYLKNDSLNLLTIITFSSLLYLPFLGEPGFSGTSEFLYATVSKEMLLGGHWVVPYFNGEAYYNKPPLFFWVVALLSKVAGEVTEVTARLPSAFSAIGTVLVTYFLGKNLFGPRAGLLAALMLACSPKFHVFARVARLDAMYTFFITCALASFYYGYTHKQRIYLLLSGFAMGLAALTKGPLSLPFPAASIFLYLAYSRDLRFLLRKDFFLSVILLLIPLLAWTVPAYIEGGKDYSSGFLSENISRYTTGRSRELIRALGYMGDLFIGLAPWAFFFPLIVYNYFSRRDKREEMVFPLIWVAVIFLGFFLCLIRRSSYILPSYPAFCIVIAHFFDTHIPEGKLMKWPDVRTFGLCLIAILIGLITGKIANNPTVGTNYIIAVTFISIAFFATLVILSIRSNSFYPFFLSCLISLSICAISQVFYFLPSISYLLSTRDLCKEVNGLVDNGARLYIYRESNSRYSFYTNNKISIIGNKDDLMRLLNSSERSYCIIRLKDYKSLNKNFSSLHAIELGSDNRYLLLFN